MHANNFVLFHVKCGRHLSLVAKPLDIVSDSVNVETQVMIKASFRAQKPQIINVYHDHVHNSYGLQAIARSCSFLAISLLLCVSHRPILQAVLCLQETVSVTCDLEINNATHLHMCNMLHPDFVSAYFGLDGSRCDMVFIVKYPHTLRYCHVSRHKKDSAIMTIELRNSP